MSNSTFGSFEIGRRAIHVQQKGVQVTGQNIANANTEGYSRQVVHMKALVPPAVPGVVTPPGYGVEVADIDRVKSEFYRGQIMKAVTAQHYWERLGQTVDGIEAIFQEPGENSINVYLNEFFDAWQELSVNPESYAVRISLREQAVSLTSLVRDIYERLDEYKFDVEKEMETAVNQINSLAAEIAGLNEKISYLQALGQKSNEMLDDRDLRLQELSGFVNIRVIQRANGSLEVLAGGRLLLHDDRSFPLAMKTLEVDENGNEVGDDESGRQVAVIVNSLGAELTVEGGALAGMLESYNEVFPRYQGSLNELVSALVKEVNALHRRGYGLDGKGPVFDENENLVEGLNNFFEPITGEDLIKNAARYFKVAEEILEDPGRIAAAVDEEGDPPAISPGDGSNALAIARLREALVLGGEDEGHTTTFHDFYRAMIADLGVEGRETGRMLQSITSVAARLREHEEAISGVSLDDEMINLVQYQHAYTAAARFLNVFDEMLGLLLSELGR